MPHERLPTPGIGKLEDATFEQCIDMYLEDMGPPDSPEYEQIREALRAAFVGGAATVITWRERLSRESPERMDANWQRWHNEIMQHVLDVTVQPDQETSQ